jgi:hypothetical protein
MAQESTAGAELKFKKSFRGTEDKTGKACNLEFSYAENRDRRGSLYVEVLNSPMMPFNHYVAVSNDSCGGDADSVKGRYSFKQDSGWHTRFTTTLNMTKLNNGTLKVVYGQDGGSNLTCTGSF